jgi:hypothetical protein
MIVERFCVEPARVTCRIARDPVEFLPVGMNVDVVKPSCRSRTRSGRSCQGIAPGLQHRDALKGTLSRKRRAPRRSFWQGLLFGFTLSRRSARGSPLGTVRHHHVARVEDATAPGSPTGS